MESSSSPSTAYKTKVLTGKKAGQYVWAYAIGSLIEEVDRIIEELAVGEVVPSTEQSSKVAA
jgi:hypothetical protein